MREAGYSGEAVYRDELSAARMKKRRPQDRYALLTQRAMMLRPTSRKAPEVIAVASMRVLALDPVDVMHCLSAALARGATVWALDTGKVYSEQVPGMAEATAMLAETGEEMRTRSRQAQTEPGRPEAVKARVLKAKKRREPKLEEARKMWGVTDLSREEIARQVGLSVATLNRHLGPLCENRKNKKKGKML